MPPRSNPRPRNNLLQSLLHVLDFVFLEWPLRPATLCSTSAQQKHCHSARSAFFALRSLLRSEESASLFFSAILSVFYFSPYSFSSSLRPLPTSYLPHP